MICDESELEIDTPRDYDGSFEQLFIKPPPITGIVEMFKERYDADVSSSLISRVTDSVKERLLEWQNRPVDAVYPIVYFDCIVVKVRQDGRIINKSVFVALDVNLEGHKELLGL